MKVANSYASLLRGVSQQVPQDRAEGQHTEQVNMLSDPVNGLTRRHGSVHQAETLLVGPTTEEVASYTEDVKSWRSYDFNIDGKEYLILYRSGARPPTANPLPLFTVYNKTDKVFLPIARNVVDTSLDLAESGGVSAITAVGKYLFFAGTDVPVTSSSVELWNTPTNLQRAVVWIRGGAYSRKYTVSVRLPAVAPITVTYTTPSSSYQAALDTSSIATADPAYTKKVNDIVNAYNGEVTKWIGTSAAATQPAAIATALKDLLVAEGVSCITQGAHICLNGVTAVAVDDGGDGSLIRGVADEIESVDKVSVIHHVGKVVKVRSRNSSEAFYLKAVAKDQAVLTGYTEVTWVEGTATERSITGGIMYATIVGGTCYVASTATLLTALTPGPHPAFVASTAGDNDSAPSPYFVGKAITYLGTFQNRLLVGSGGVLAVSKTDDFLNFYRSTVLTLPANDPFDMLAQGSQDDTLRAGVLYDQDMVIFGKKRQYVINGNAALTPTSANMAVMSNYEGVTDTSPIAAGGYILYAKRGELFTSLYQIQPGQTANSPEAYPASSQIDSYLLGSGIELVGITGSPSMAFLRTTGSPNSIYVFAYLDKQDGRKMDSWSRWDFNPELGSVCGMGVVTDGIIALFMRVGAGGVYLVADRCLTTTVLSTQPYLDSLRPYASVAAGTGSVTLAGSAEWAAAFDSTSARRFTGTFLPNVGVLLTNYPGEPGMLVGAVQDSYVELTNPFMRDPKNKAILSGRLTITKLVVAFKNTTGYRWLLSYRGTPVSDVTFNGRILGDPANVVGIEPVSTGQSTIPVGRETRQYTLRIQGRRWYPFTITAIEWVGQFFNRVQRF